MTDLLDRLATSPPDEAQALALVAWATGADRPSAGPGLAAAARERRARVRGAVVGFSPKVFLPVTNLCRNRCDYCTFRKSPGDEGVWTMRPDEVVAALDAGAAHGCAEALLCLGDTPERAYASYRRTLQELGAPSTAAYLARICELALERGLLPHTNAGILTADELRLLRPLNVSMGLMLESSSDRLCEPGMPHHRAPDKRPAVRLAMISEAGRQRIPFTSGILIGIGETPLERMQSLLALRRLHREHGHLQEVIIQNFRAKPDIPMHGADEPGLDDLLLWISLARIVLDDEVVIQAPPNLSPGATRALLDAGLEDFGGISPVTPDYINPGHPWPQLDRLADDCARAGSRLQARLAVHERYAAGPWQDPAITPCITAARGALRRNWGALAGAPRAEEHHRVTPPCGQLPRAVTPPLSGAERS